MSKGAILEPGRYKVNVTLELWADVEEGDYITEGDLVADCRQHGERIDWDVEER